MLVSALLLECFTRLGVVGEGDSLSSGQSSTGLSYLNDMLDKWNAEGLLTPYRQVENFSLAAGNASRTIGPTGNFVTTRPIDIIRGYVRVGGQDHPIEAIGFDAFQRIANKSQAGRPYQLTYQKTPTNGTIYFFFVPDQTYTVYLESEKLWGALLTSDDFLPQPGVMEAVKNCLQIRLAPYCGVQADPSVIALGSAALRAMRNRAYDGSGAPMNTAILQTRTGGYSIDRGW